MNFTQWLSSLSSEERAELNNDPALFAEAAFNGAIQLGVEATDSGLEMEPTERGFGKYDFKDDHGEECSIQQSSVADRSCIWLGLNDVTPMVMSKTQPGWEEVPMPEGAFIGTRMHLGIDEVKSILPTLIKFVKTGDI